MLCVEESSGWDGVGEPRPPGELIRRGLMALVLVGVGGFLIRATPGDRATSAPPGRFLLEPSEVNAVAKAAPHATRKVKK